MNIDINSIPWPDQKDLTLQQKNNLEIYQEICSKLQKKSYDKDLVDYGTKMITSLYHEFDHKLKEKYKYWYKYQINFIDPYAGPCMKISEIIAECNMEKKMAITEDGKEILIQIEEGSFATTKLLKLLSKELPGLDYKIIK